MLKCVTLLLISLSLSATSYKVSQQELATALNHLSAFVAIPSVSNPASADYNPADLQSAADFATERLKEIDFQVRQVSIDNSAPFVLAQKIVDAAKPTLLLYAHYDVQPVDREKWTTNPFELTELNGRLYARGASDDKGGIIGIITALNAYQKAYGALPCNIKILFEGEEEYGSSHMQALINQEKDTLKADALVVLDGGNVDTQIGTLTNSTRGLVNLYLTIRSMEKPIHSGIGCMAPDPSIALAEIMVALKNPRNIPGYTDDCTPLQPLERALLSKDSQTPESFAADHNLVPNAPLRGDPTTSIYERITEEPSISFVNGAWGKPNGGSSIQDSAFTQIGVRLTAGQNPERIAKLLITYITTHPAVQGFEVTITQPEQGSFAWKGDLSRPLSQKYLQALEENFAASHVQPCGGALPFLHEFEAIFPNMEMIIPGVEDPKCGAHSHNESQDIGLFERAINSLIAFIHKVGKA